MIAFNNSARSKKGLVLLILAFTATSLFGFVIPKIFTSNDKVDKPIENKVNFNPHPLVGISDNDVLCAETGQDLHEIFLCGINDERLLVTNIPNFTQITWSKLEEGSCNDAVGSCPNSGPTCNWNELSTDTQFNVTEAGEYKIFVTFSDGSIDNFYFNVYANGLNPNALVQNIDCGTPGSISITNVPSGYEYSITSGASWQASNVFPITSVSSYDVQIRKANDPGTCVLTLDDIPVGNNDIIANPTVTQITCNAASGEITIDITNASTS